MHMVKFNLKQNYLPQISHPLNSNFVFLKTLLTSLLTLISQFLKVSLYHIIYFVFIRKQTFIHLQLFHMLSNKVDF